MEITKVVLIRLNLSLEGVTQYFWQYSVSSHVILKKMHLYLLIDNLWYLQKKKLYIEKYI